MRASGVALLILVFGHLFANLWVGEGIKAIDFAFVAGKWSDPFWQVWDLAMLWLALIHGTNGMGKTHLLYAIQKAVKQTDPNYRIKLISSEAFVSGFVSSVRGGNGREAIDAFKSSLRNVDLLIIDDAHFIADKPSSQEELLHTLISLVDEGRQILIAADRHDPQIVVYVLWKYLVFRLAHELIFSSIIVVHY